MAQSRIPQLLDWCAAHNIFIDPDIQLSYNTLSGIHVCSASEHEIPVGRLLVRIPKTCVLSVKTCSFAREISTLGLDSVGFDAQLGLALALCLEMALGESSPWFGYLQSIPLSVDVPMFWQSDDPDTKQSLYFLERSQLSSTLRGSYTMTRLEAFHTAIMNAAERDLLPVRPSFDEFRTAFALVSTRAFIVDAYRGLCMVPMADALNHSQPNHVQLESEHDVCPLCGSLAQCPHDTEGDSMIAFNQEVDGSDDLEMTTLVPVFPGEEVFNSYGAALPNVELLWRYGFLLEGNDNDIVLFQDTDLFEATQPAACLSSADMARLAEKVQKQRGSHSRPSNLLFHVSERNHPLLGINADGKISYDLWLLLAALYGEQTKLPVSLADLLACQVKVEAFSQDIQARTDSQQLDEASASILKAVANVVEILCATRLRRVLPDGCVTCAEGFAQLDALPPSFTRSRLALQLLLTEAAILESCKETWAELKSLCS